MSHKKHFMLTPIERVHSSEFPEAAAFSACFQAVAYFKVSSSYSASVPSFISPRNLTNLRHEFGCIHFPCSFHCSLCACQTQTFNDNRIKQFLRGTYTFRPSICYAFLSSGHDIVPKPSIFELKDFVLFDKLLFLFVFDVLEEHLHLRFVLPRFCLLLNLVFVVVFGPFNLSIFGITNLSCIFPANLCKITSHNKI